MPSSVQTPASFVVTSSGLVHRPRAMPPAHSRSMSVAAKIAAFTQFERPRPASVADVFPSEANDSEVAAKVDEPTSLSREPKRTRVKQDAENAVALTTTVNFVTDSAHPRAEPSTPAVTREDVRADSDTADDSSGDVVGAADSPAWASAPSVEAYAYLVYPSNYLRPDAPRDRSRYVAEIVRVMHPSVPTYWVVRAESGAHLTIYGEWMAYTDSTLGDPHPTRYRFRDFEHAQRHARTQVDSMPVGGMTFVEACERTSAQRPIGRVFRNR